MARKLRLKSAPKLPSSAGGYSFSSAISIPRRSNGEKEILELAGKSLLLTKWLSTRMQLG